MSVWQDIYVVENNDILFTFNLTDSSGDPFTLTGYSASLVVKASPTALDNSGITFSTGNGGLTVASAILGKITWPLQHAHTGTVGTQWYRLDVIDGSSNVTTMMMGNLYTSAA